MAELNYLAGLQQLTNQLEESFDFKTFFAGMMQAFGLTKTYVESAWSNDPSFNCANADGHLGLVLIETQLARPDIGIQKRALFRFVNHAEDVREQLDEAINSPCFLNKNFKIPVVIAVSPEFICLYNAIENEYFSFELEKLPQFYGSLLPLTANYKRIEVSSSTHADEKACRKLAQLMDSIESLNRLSQADSHALNDFMRHLVFCLFAEDTGLFEPNLFTSSFAKLSGKNGELSQQFFQDLFLVLNTPQELRDSLQVSQMLLAFPYVGGDLFTATSFIPKFNFTIREKLIDCGRIEWDQISPAIFGSMFQYALDPDEQRQEGAHYTSEQNILKLIKPLFLDDLTQQVEAFENEFQAINASEVMGAEQAQAGNKTLKSVKKEATDKLNDLEQRAAAFLEKLGHIKIMDPACGCGNFLIVAYRELRRLENRVLKLLYRETTLMQDVVNSKVTLDHFYGIEIEDWPTEIAQLSMWLMQHQVNREMEQLFGKSPASLPLSTAAHIYCANALTTDWNEILPAGECSYLVGNPPFGGAVTTNSEQKAWLKAVYPEKYPIGFADFVTAWFVKAASYMQFNQDCHTAFVATNSICQGQQVKTLWGLLMKQGIVINFAYTSFRWNNEAVNAAKVFCVIVGFSYQTSKSALLFRELSDGSFVADEVQAISPYLMDESTCTIIEAQNTSLSNVKPLKFGNMAIDNGNFLLDVAQGNKFVEQNHQVNNFLKIFMGSAEVCNNTYRYCLWLADKEPTEWESVPFIADRVEKCRVFRENSKQSGGAYKYRNTPWLFGQIVYKTLPKTSLVIPRVTSEKRPYIPLNIVNDLIVVSDLAFLIPDPELFYYSILNSRMHNVWMHLTSGRLGECYRYSRDFTYNTFIWPELNAERKLELTALGTRIFDFCSSSKMTLGDLNDPKLMPIELKLLHEQLDTLVESYYRQEPFKDDDERLSHLIGLYRKRVDALAKGETQALQSPLDDGQSVEQDKVNDESVCPWLTPLNANHIMVLGSHAGDGGYLQLSESEALVFLSQSPEWARQYLHRFINSQAFYNKQPQYCLWVDVAREEAEIERAQKAAKVRADKAARAAKAKSAKGKKGKVADADAVANAEDEIQELEAIASRTWKQVPFVWDQVEKCRNFRMAAEPGSLAFQTRYEAFAFSKITYPPLRQSKLMMPSLIRKSLGYIPTWFTNQPYVMDDSVCVIPSQDILDCAIINSRMHWVWMDFTSDYDELGNVYHYSIEKTYNNLIYPHVPDDIRDELTDVTTQFMLLTNCYAERFGQALDLSLADENNDGDAAYRDVVGSSDAVSQATAKAVLLAQNRMNMLLERCYRPEPFADDQERLEFLRQLYFKYKF